MKKIIIIVSSFLVVVATIIGVNYILNTRQTKLDELYLKNITEAAYSNGYVDNGFLTKNFDLELNPTPGNNLNWSLFVSSIIFKDKPPMFSDDNGVQVNFVATEGDLKHQYILIKYFNDSSKIYFSSLDLDEMGIECVINTDTLSTSGEECTQIFSSYTNDYYLSNALKLLDQECEIYKEISS